MYVLLDLQGHYVPYHQISVKPIPAQMVALVKVERLTSPAFVNMVFEV